MAKVCAVEVGVGDAAGKTDGALASMRGAAQAEHRKRTAAEPAASLEKRT